MIFRTLTAALLLTAAAPAYAGPPTDTEKAETPLKRPALPTEAEINEIIEDLPDFNAIMSDMLKIVQNPEIMNEMKKSGEAFAKKMENSGALELDENGMPDFNAAIGTMLGALSDEEVTGDMLDNLTGMAQAFQSLEKHFDGMELDFDFKPQSYKPANDTKVKPDWL